MVRAPRRLVAIQLACLRFLAIASLAMPALLHAQSFRSLGSIDDVEVFYAEPNGVSDDGDTIVGRWFPNGNMAAEWAFRWQPGTGMTRMSFPSLSRTIGIDVSGDGAKTLIQGNRLFYYVSSPSGTLYIGDVGPTGRGRAISADGQVVVGARDTASSGSPVYEAFRWTQATGIQGLGFTEAFDVSSDGSVVVGTRRYPNPSGSGTVQGAHVWRNGTGTDVVANKSFASATAVSSDGSTVFGVYTDGGGSDTHDYTFRERSGITIIDPGPDQVFAPLAASEDGSIAVGEKIYPADFHQAVIWTEAGGVRKLRDVAVNDLGLDLTGWTLQRATGVSADGRVVIGYGNSPEGRREAWRLELAPDTERLVVNVTVDEENDEQSAAEDICDVDRDEPDLQCSLRAAITLANTRGGGTIEFDVPAEDLPANGVPEFRLGDAFESFPPISRPITLDGTSQPGAGKVELIGRRFDAPQSIGIEIGPLASRTEVRGLVINGFYGGGIVVRSGAEFCVIADNVIGLDAQGLERRGNGSSAVGDGFFDGEAAGVVLWADRTLVENNVIAGNTPAAMNGVVCGGVDLYIGDGADQNEVRGNLLGVRADGEALADVPPEPGCVYHAVVVAGGDGNVVGFNGGELPLEDVRFPVCEGACNVIGQLVSIRRFADADPPHTYPQPTNTLVAGNRIGVKRDGTPLPTYPVALDVVEGDGHRVLANVFGGMPQTIFLAATNAGPLTRVTIRANEIREYVGPDEAPFGAIMFGGSAETDVVANDILGGRGWGIYMLASERARIERNRISGQRSGGIGMADVPFGIGNQALLSRNQIVDSNIAIDLGVDGATRNDGGDTDGGPNGYLNFPAVHAATHAGNAVSIEGFVQLPLTTSAHTIEVFSSARCNDGQLDAHGGQAERYLGSYTGEATAGDPDFVITIDGVAGDHRYLSLTTSLVDEGITSEHSRCIPFAAPGEVASVDLPADPTGARIDAQGLTVTGGPSSSAVASFARRAASGTHRLWVTRYERAPEMNGFSAATATGVGGVPIAPTGVAPRHWYVSDRNLTAAGGGVDDRTFEVCLDPTNVVRPVALRSVVVVRRDDATGRTWVPNATTRRVRDDGAVLLCASVPALGELALGGAPAAFSDGPSDACSPLPVGVTGARCLCDTLPPLACDTLPSSFSKATMAACGKVAQAVGQPNEKKARKLRKAARAKFKKLGKLLGKKSGRGLPDACRAALAATARDGQAQLAP